MSNASNSKTPTLRDAAHEKNIESLLKFVMLLAEKNRINPEHARMVYEAILNAPPRKGLSDEELAGKFKLSQSEIRRILRLLYNNALAKFRRGRHPETGATRYYWYVDLNQINLILVKRKREVLAKLKARLEYERSNTFYYCPHHPNHKYTFEEAFAYNFQCPKCGAILEEFDNRERVRILEDIVRRLEEEIRRDEQELAATT